MGAGRGGQLSLYSLVKSLADNKQLLGMRYAEWCIAAPTLEADIAAAAMGLDDIGHSRVLYGSLRELGTEDGAVDDAANYANVPYLDRPWTEWAEFVAANAVQEERYHTLHGRSWMREVEAGAALERAWRESLEWIGPEDGDVDELHRAGQLAHGVRDLRRLLEDRLDGRPPEAAIEWGSWEPIRRRTQTGGIDQATLDMLQGLAEKRYMPAGGG